MMEQLGVATAGEMGIETLYERLRDEVVSLGGMIAFPSLVGAWARKPVEQGNRARRPGSASIQRNIALTEWTTQDGGKSVLSNL